MTEPALRARESRALLLVEDDPTVARAVVRVLRSRGYLVDVASSCVSARSQADRRTYPVGIVDVELPDGFGPDLASELLDAGRVRRVVFFTSGTLQQALRRAAALGPVVAKREGPEALLGVVAEQVELCDVPSQSGFIAQGRERAEKTGGSG